MLSPFLATSTAAGTPISIFSIRDTSSTMGIWVCRRLAMSTPSSRWQMAATTRTRGTAALIKAAAS